MRHLNIKIDTSSDSLNEAFGFSEEKRHEMSDILGKITQDAYDNNRTPGDVASALQETFDEAEILVVATMIVMYQLNNKLKNDVIEQKLREFRQGKEL